MRRALADARGANAGLEAAGDHGRGPCRSPSWRGIHMSNKFKLSRRDVLKIGAVGGAASVIGASALAPRSASAQVAACSGLPALEAFPTSPLILNPFTDPLPVPQAQAPVPAADVANWTHRPGSGPCQQDWYGVN